MPPDKLDLGGRLNAPEGYLTLDRKPPADIVCDLESPGDALGKERWDEVRAHDLLEHIRNLCPLMDAVWESLKPGGTFDIRVPLFPHGPAVHDPTHVRFFTADTFSYFTKDFAYFGYVDHPWEKESLEVRDSSIFVKLKKI
jgi:hypothetical protein